MVVTHYLIGYSSDDQELCRQDLDWKQPVGSAMCTHRTFASRLPSAPPGEAPPEGAETSRPR